jgi:hypothetical protein
MNIHSRDEVELRTLLSFLDRFRTEQAHFMPYETYRKNNPNNAKNLEERWSLMKQLLEERKGIIEKQLSMVVKIRNPITVRKFQQYCSLVIGIAWKAKSSNRLVFTSYS